MNNIYDVTLLVLIFHLIGHFALQGPMIKIFTKSWDIHNEPEALDDNTDEPIFIMFSSAIYSAMFFVCFGINALVILSMNFLIEYLRYCDQIDPIQAELAHYMSLIVYILVVMTAII
jgi:hypothetical protein